MRRVLAVALVIGGIAGLADAGVASAPAKVTRAEIRKLRQAAQRTIEAGPRASEVEVDLTIPEDPPSPDRTIQPFRARGVVDPATGATVGTLEVLLDEFGDVPDTTLEVRAASAETSFLRSGALTLPAGKVWVEVPTARLANATSTTSALSYLSDFVGAPRFIGESTDRGVKVRRYAVDVPVRTIIESGGLPTTKEVERELRRLERAGRGTAICNITIDTDGRIRFFATYLQLAFRGEGPELDVIGQFYDYGTPLDASPPPAEQVVAFDDVADQLEPFLGPVAG